MARFKLTEISVTLKCRRPLVALAPVSMTDAEATTPWLDKHPRDLGDAYPTKGGLGRTGEPAISGSLVLPPLGRS